MAVADAGEAQQAIDTAITAQAPPPVAALSPEATREGVAHFKMAASAEGLPGEMIYSQNCYDALGRHFSWAKLDTCGAFDAEAAELLGDETPPGQEKEVAWFQSETAAGRFLKAATAGGQDADAADIRLSDLQSRIPKARPIEPQANEADALETAGEAPDPTNVDMEPARNSLTATE